MSVLKNVLWHESLSQVPEVTEDLNNTFIRLCCCLIKSILFRGLASFYCALHIIYIYILTMNLFQNNKTCNQITLFKSHSPFLSINRTLHTSAELKLNPRN